MANQFYAWNTTSNGMVWNFTAGRVPANGSDSAPADIVSLVATPVSSWTALKTGIAKGGTATFTLTAPFNSDYDSRITIPDGAAITIQGGGAVLDAGSKGQFFKVSGALTLNFLTLQNGGGADASSDGGAIECNAGCILNVNSCAFNGNNAKGHVPAWESGSSYLYSGGAITFYQENKNGGTTTGGPIGYISNTTFTSNSANSGGAISLAGWNADGAGNPKCTITGSAFSGNSADSPGSGKDVYIFDGHDSQAGGSVPVGNAVFVDCKGDSMPMTDYETLPTGCCEVCPLCTCSPAQFVKTNCTDTQARVCQDCTVCPPGKHVETKCTAHKDTTCAFDPVRRGIDSGVALDASSGTVYFGSWDNNFYAVDTATGKQKWALPTGGLIQSGVALDTAADTVFFGSWEAKPAPTPAPVTPAPTPAPTPRPSIHFALESGSSFSGCFPATYTSTDDDVSGQPVFQSDSTASSCNDVEFLLYCSKDDLWLLYDKKTVDSKCDYYLGGPQFLTPTATWIFSKDPQEQTWKGDSDDVITTTASGFGHSAPAVIPASLTTSAVPTSNTFHALQASGDSASTKWTFPVGTSHVMISARSRVLCAFTSLTRRICLAPLRADHERRGS
jgi:hypothetical protein